MITHPKFLQKSFGSISTSILSQRIEQDFQNRIGQPLVVVESAEAMIPNVFSRLSNAIGFAKRRFAKAGAAFGLTYIIISNLNGSISLSLAWYMASKQTGLSPLAPGQWKALLAAYASLYMLITLARPLRVALAFSLTKNTEEYLLQTEERFGISRAAAIVLNIPLGLILWIGCAVTGVGLASILSGVPIW